MCTHYRTAFFATTKSYKVWYEKQRPGLEQEVFTHRTSRQSGWPRGFGALNSSSLSWIFTSASVGSSPLSYLFTSATLRIPVHTASKCGTDLSDMCRSTFEIFESLQKSPRNHRSYVWREGQSGMVLIPAQELSVIVSTYPTSNHLLTIILQVHNQTSRHLTRCQCSHLTWFGADLFIPPNKLDIKASIKKLAELHKHPALLATFCTIIGLYILGMIWARRKDRKDITKVWVKYLSCLQLSEPSQQWKRFLRARQAPTLRVATSSLPNLPLS